MNLSKLSRLNSILREAQKKIQRDKKMKAFLNTGKMALSDDPDADAILKEAAEALADTDEQEFNEAYSKYMQQFEDMIFNSAPHNNALITIDDVLKQYDFFKERLDQVPALRKQSQEGLDYDELLKAYNDLDYSTKPFVDEKHPNGVLLRRTPKGLFDESNNLVIAPPDYEQSKQFAAEKLKRLGKESQDKYKSILADAKKRGYKDLPKSLSEYFRQLTNTRNMFGRPNIIGKDTLGNNIYETYIDTFGNKATVGNMRSHWLSGANPTKDILYIYYKPNFGFAPVRREKALEDEAKKIYKSLGIAPDSKKRTSAEMVKFNREKKYIDDIVKNAYAALFQQYDYIHDLSAEEKAALRDKNKKTMMRNRINDVSGDLAAKKANEAKYDRLWQEVQQEVPGIENRMSRKHFIDILHNTPTIDAAVAEAKKFYESGYVDKDIMP